jgi:hypothetical protein
MLAYKSEDSLRHRSFTRFKDLPVVNQRSLIVPKVHLPPRAFRRIHEGFDGRLDNATQSVFLKCSGSGTTGGSAAERNYLISGRRYCSRRKALETSTD